MMASANLQTERLPRPCQWSIKRTCDACGNGIAMGERGYVIGDVPKNQRHYHTNCLIRFLYGAWRARLDHSFYEDAMAARAEAKMWKGNHDYVSDRKRRAERRVAKLVFKLNEANDLIDQLQARIERIECDHQHGPINKETDNG